MAPSLAEPVISKLSIGFISQKYGFKYEKCLNECNWKGWWCVDVRIPPPVSKSEAEKVELEAETEL